MNRPLTKGIYNVVGSTWLLRVLVVSFDDGVKVSFKAQFITKVGYTPVGLPKNYKLPYDRISHWEKVL